MFRFFISLAFIGWGLSGFAEETPGVKGKVLDISTNQPLEYATVSVYKASDESLVTGTVTDLNGEFKLSLIPDNYILKIQFVTFETLEVEIKIESGRGTLDLGTLKASPSEKELDAVVVQGERTQMQLNLDKKVYNIGKDLSSLGGSASDILDNLPSVSVDVEGNVQLRGSSGVKILIDGKPSGLVGLSSTDALRQLQGNLIERIEIITNPSARYDAEGMVGIINIILKKDKGSGLNGSFQATTGYPHNHGISANVNFRKEWVNLFVNYGVNYDKAPGLGSGHQVFNLPDTAYTTDLSRYSKRGGISNNVRFGADFFLNDHNSLTTSFLYRYSDELNESDMDYLDRTVTGSILQFTKREDEENEGGENLEYSVNYTHTFENENHKLTADIQFQDNNELEKSDIRQLKGTDESLATPILFQKVRNDEGEKRLMLQADYIRPVGSKGKVEAGMRSTMRDVKNIYDVSQRPDESAAYVALDSFSTNFAYSEGVHAAYAILSNEFDKISWQLGLRSETTDINTLFEETNEKQNWNYTNLFPSAFFTYKLTAKTQVQLSYSRRINRPAFRMLNPFSSFTDNRNFRVGNPALQPEFTDSYETGFLFNLNKSSISSNLYYRYTSQLIQRVVLAPDENGIRYQMPFNIGESHAFGVELNGSHEFAEWYRVSGNFNLYALHTQGKADSIKLEAQAVSFSTRISNVINVNDWFNAQVNVNYRAPEKETQGKRLSMTSVDLGLTKDVWKNNGTLSLSVRDLFNSRKYRYITELETLYETGTWQWRKGPMFVATLTYRLNQAKQKRVDKQRGEGFGDEGF